MTMYKNEPKTSQLSKITILWNQHVRTDRTISNNKPDIIIRDNKKGICMLIDVAIFGDRNAIKKEPEKILNYKDLITEIQRMWNVKAKVIPVIIGATGTISKSLRQYLSYVPGKRTIKELQKQPYWALHNTTVRASVKVNNIFHGRNNTTCSNNCKYKTAATLYTLAIWFVSGI